MTNVAVSGVTRPMANQKVSLKVWRAPLLKKKLGGACMCDARAGADAPLLGGFKWLPCWPPFAMH